MLKLYHHPVSTCSQKVRLALAEKGLTFDQHVIDWTVMEHLEDWYLAINPNGVVPTLVHDDAVIVDSSVICEYIDEMWPERPLVPSTARERAEMRAWMRYLEEVPTSAIRVPSFNALFTRSIKGQRSDAEFAEMTARMPLRKHFYRKMNDTGFDRATLEESKERLRSCLERVDRALADGRPWLLAYGYSLADIVLTPSVVRMDDLGMSYLWQDLDAMQQWFERISARPAFAEAYMPGSRVDPARYRLDQGNPS